LSAIALAKAKGAAKIISPAPKKFGAGLFDDPQEILLKICKYQERRIVGFSA
jgi:hypothetical protein